MIVVVVEILEVFIAHSVDSGNRLDDYLIGRICAHSPVVHNRSRSTGMRNVIDQLSGVST